MPQNKLTQEEVEKRGKEKGVTVLSEYCNSREKINVKCDNCNSVWSVRPSNLFSGAKCQKCKGNKIAQSTPEESYLDQLNKRINNGSVNNIHIIVYNGYNNNSIAKCSNCCHQWETFPSYLVSQTKEKGNVSCPRCRNKEVDQTGYEEIISELSLVYKELPLYSHNLHSFVCKICDKEFKTTIDTLRGGVGCSSCEKSPAYREIKYQHYASCNNMKYKQFKGIIDSEKIAIEYIHVWACPNNHMVYNGPDLRNIKKLNVKDWCIECEWDNVLNTLSLYEKAIEKKVSYEGGIFSGRDSLYLWRCKYKHPIPFTFQEILDGEWNVNCPTFQEDMGDIDLKCQNAEVDDGEKLLLDKHSCQYPLFGKNKVKYKVCCEDMIESENDKLNVIEKRYIWEHAIELEEMKDMNMDEYG